MTIPHLPPRLGSDDPSDLFGAEQFVQQHGAYVRYTKAAGWRLWTGTRWAVDTRNDVTNLAKVTVRGLRIPDTAYGQKEKLKAWFDYLARSQNAGGIAALLRLASSEPGVAMDEPDFDRDPWRLNCANVTVDLRTGRTYDPRPTDYITHQIPVAYDPEAPCPRWNAFLHRVLGGDADLVRFVRLAVGYSLTGVTDEQCVFFLYGTGRNGKSTFIETLQALFGSYSVKLPMETFLVRKNEGVNWNLADLFGRRLAVASEIEQGRRLAEAVVKDLSGSDTISAQRKHQDPFQFVPETKLWMYGNHKPILVGAEEGIKRRIKLIPFTQTIPPAEVDRQLGRKLRDELPGILAQAVRDCLQWQAQGLDAPLAVTDATAAYFSEMDILAPFLTSTCVLDPNARVAHKELYAAYGQWAEENNIRMPLTGPQFTKALNERGLFSKAGAGNVVTWHGIGLVNSSYPDSTFFNNSTGERKNMENRITPLNSRNGATPAPLCPQCGEPMYKGHQTGRWICGTHPLAGATEAEV